MKFTSLVRIAMVLTCLFNAVLQSKAQDTTRIALPDAEKQFTAKNLELMAEKYNIDIARAQVLQARVYNNPNLQLVANVYNPDQKKWFDVSNGTGEYIANVQQLIILAGKRNKQIKLAQ